MPIEFRCTRCTTLLRTKEEAAGRQFNCPKCGQTLTVPAPEVGAAGPAPAGGAEQPATAPATLPGEEVNPYQAPESVEASWQPPPHGGPNGPAIASLVLGICSLPAVCCCGLLGPPLGLPMSAIGLILGIIGLKSESKGLAIAGIVLCSVGLVIGLLVALLFVFAMVMGDHPMMR